MLMCPGTHQGLQPGFGKGKIGQCVICIEKRRGLNLRLIAFLALKTPDEESLSALNIILSEHWLLEWKFSKLCYFMTNTLVYPAHTLKM